MRPAFADLLSDFRVCESRRSAGRSGWGSKGFDHEFMFGDSPPSKESRDLGDMDFAIPQTAANIAAMQIATIRLKRGRALSERLGCSVGIREGSIAFRFNDLV